jgi:SAM-dependent methyltransferase
MVGMGFDAKAAEQRELLRALGVDGRRGGTALDLGCGPGYQSAALLELGFERVLAVDSCGALLDELNRHLHGPAIECVQGDLVDAVAGQPRHSIAAVVCMGDTLTHLDSTAEIRRLFRTTFDALRPGGVFVLTFRDLSVDVTDEQRFVLVRADEQRLMTCVLEYESDVVWVHDVVHSLVGGRWSMAVGRYRKLRLAAAVLHAELEAAGFVVNVDRPVGRLHSIVATRGG